MATEIYSTSDYAVFEMRGAAILLRNKITQEETFFQPGDDAQSMRDTVEALEEAPENKRDVLFNIACGAYL